MNQTIGNDKFMRKLSQMRLVKLRQDISFCWICTKTFHISKIRLNGSSFLKAA